MTFKQSAWIVAVLGVASAIPALGRNSANPVQSAHRETLLVATSSWDGKPYSHYSSGQPQLTTIKLTLAPHTVLPWHTHPVPNVVYVLSGTLTLRERENNRTLVVHQGQSVGESVDVVHRGESGDTQTVLLITYAGTPGVPTSIPAKGEKAEY